MTHSGLLMRFHNIQTDTVFLSNLSHQRTAPHRYFYLDLNRYFNRYFYRYFYVKSNVKSNING